MARVATEHFRLNIDGKHHAYSAGDKINPEHTDHWYAQAHSAEVEADKKPKAKKADGDKEDKPE